MNGILNLFPQSNFSLIAVILGMPLLGAIINGLWGRRLGKEAVRMMALVAIGVSFLASVLTFVALDKVIGATKMVGMHDGHEVAKYGHAKLSWMAWEWMGASTQAGRAVPIELKFSVDALSGVMMLVVTGVGFLIHLYATSYMAKDKAFWRFFTYLNLFVFSMLVLILADNLPVLFVGWEGVGLCSYLLIGFWYDKAPNASAGKKAFIANRIGDFGLICGMFLLVYYTGALDWHGIETGAGSLVTTTDNARVHLWPIGGGQFSGWLSFLQPKHPVTISAATAVALALFLGCTGKSAQIPLYTWLPDAMAGPTPVSALIHAATMVTAGIYLICRLSFVFVLSPGVMMIIAIIGAATALFAALLALVQYDIKKVLAFSTVSQLGFMFLGVGVGAFTAGFFHVFTHAFFKACLFLGAGSVIHAMHARIHDGDKSQDMRNMGGLKKYMPITFWTFAVSTAAIVGFPLTSGFFSKDEILYKAWINHTVSPAAASYAARGKIHLFEPPTWLGPVLYFVGLAAATLTAFYMSRAFIMTFLGEFRGWKIGRPSLLAKQAEAHHDHGDDEHDDEHHHEENLQEPGYAPHESPWQMTVPLIVLGTAAVGAGILNPGLLKHVLHLDDLPMDHWLEPVFDEATAGGVKVAANAHTVEWPLTGGAFLAFAVGTFLAYQLYVVRKGTQEEALQQTFRKVVAAAPGVLGLVFVACLYLNYGSMKSVTANVGIVPAILVGALALGCGYLVYSYKSIGLDELYDKTVVNGVDALSETAASVDQSIVDGVLARLTALIVAATGTVLRAVQNGVVHVYAGIMVAGLAALGWFFVAPHADATVTQATNGDFVVEAAPGLGYSYRWYEDAAGKPDNETYTGDTKKKYTVEPGKKRVVRVEVANAFGFTTGKNITLERAKEAPKAVPIKLGQIR